MSARVAVAKGKFVKGFNGDGRDVPAAYEVLELHDALSRVYACDAHLVTYVVRDAAWQPRINKPGIAHFEGVVETSVFFCDVDNPGHAEWTSAMFDEAMREYETLGALATAGIYHTTHGRRFVQPIAELIPVQKVEPYLRRWLRELELGGIVVDWNCRDWTRHFRLPHVHRAGRAFRSPYVALERMSPIQLEPIAEVELPAAAPARSRKAPAASPLLPWTTDVPGPWHSRVGRIAAAVRVAEGNWHELFLAIAGALLARGVPHEHIPMLNRAISIACGADTRTDDRELAGRSTVERHRAGAPVAGHAVLRRTWPAVAEAIDAALATGAEARLRAHAEAAPAPPTQSIEVTTAALEEAIRNAPEGLTLIKAECGLGKTAAIRRIAKERSDKGYATPDAVGARAPNQSKTSISVDKNTLAVQITRDLRAAGATVKRLFGPLSVLRDDRTPECRFHDTARLLVAGGQSVQREFCQARGQERCEFYEICLARDGIDGPPNARIAVGPHALLSELNGAAGSTGLLVIDEPPALLETTELAVTDFDVALAGASYFAPVYMDAMRPALRALRAWTETIAPLDLAHPPLDALQGGSSHVSRGELCVACRAAGAEADPDAPDALAACVRGALSKERRGSAPPIQRMYASAARRALALATELGAASRVLRAVYAAVTAEAPVAVRVEERRGERVLLLTQAREDVVLAVKREGAVVVADANVEIHAPVLAKVVGYEPPVHCFAAGDGAPIGRTLFRTGAATRRTWLPNGNLAIDAGILSAVATVLAWAAEDSDARELAIITFLPLEVALRAALHPEDAAAGRAWKSAGQRPEDLPRIRSELLPVLAKWPGKILLGHYGAMRGLDAMKNVDALATIGDPWPHLGEVQHDIAFLGLEQAWESRLQAMCRAELEQAHGRLRTVHRTRPGRALHVGKELPGGSGWRSDAIAIRQDRGGRPRNVSAMTNNELVPIVARLGGVRAAARAVGCNPATMSRYVNGEVGVPPEAAAKLRAICRPIIEVAGISLEQVPANDREADSGVAQTSN